MMSVGRRYLDLKAPVFDVVPLKHAGRHIQGCQEAFVAVAGGGTTKAGMQNGLHVVALEPLEDGQYALAEANFCDTGSNFCTSITASQDGGYLVAASQRNILVFSWRSNKLFQLGSYTPALVHDVNSGKENDNEISCVSISTPNTHVVCGDHKGNVYLHKCYFQQQLMKMSLVSRFQFHSEEITFLAFDENSNMIGCGSADGKATLWNPVTGIFHTLPSIASEQITTAAPPKRPGRRKRINKAGTCSYRGVIFSSKCVHCLESTQFVSSTRQEILVESSLILYVRYFATPGRGNSVKLDTGGGRKCSYLRLRIVSVK
eukprot:gb/GECG01002929.1/.p1 GENE.gb/GECG01002929.1/~~gb/GECG01002929.1/.p1  ORF type:complete len:317 (+),score=27.07 gb/GECG01002929.1/:1-951(+)